MCDKERTLNNNMNRIKVKPVKVFYGRCHVTNSIVVANELPIKTGDMLYDYVRKELEPIVGQFHANHFVLELDNGLFLGWNDWELRIGTEWGTLEKYYEVSLDNVPELRLYW